MSPSVITVVIRKQREISPQREGDLVIEAETVLMHFEDGGREHKPGNKDGH